MRILTVILSILLFSPVSVGEDNPNLEGTILEGIYTSSLDTFSLEVPQGVEYIEDRERAGVTGVVFYRRHKSSIFIETSPLPPKHIADITQLGTETFLSIYYRTVLLPETTKIPVVDQISTTYEIKPEKFKFVMDLQKADYYPDLKGGALSIGFFLKNGETKQLRNLQGEKYGDIPRRDVYRAIIAFVHQGNIYALTCEQIFDEKKPLADLQEEAMSILKRLSIPGR